jgi:hypothetical protein
LENGLPVEKPVSAVNVTYASPDLTISLGGAATATGDIEVWFQLEDGVSQPVVMSLEIADGQGSGSVPVTLTAGTPYTALVMAPGFGVATDTFTA